MPPKKKDTKTAAENGLSSGSAAAAAAVKKNEDEPVGRTLRKRKVKIQTPAKSLGFKIAVKTTRKKSITNNTNGTAKVVKKKTPPSSIESASIKRRVLIKRQPKAKAEAEAEEHQVIEKVKRNNAAKSKVTLKVQKVNTNNKTSTKQQQNKKATSASNNNNNNNKKKTADSKKAKINVQIENTQLPEPIRQSDSKENDAVNVQQEVQIKKGRKTKKQIILEETEDSKTAVVPPPKKRVKKNNDAATEENGEEAKDDKRTILDFSAKLIDGTTETRLKKYKGHVCIIVNVASKCGHTATNYKQFVELHEKYAKSKGLRILAFPCNQFGKQEPADNQKICQFAKKKNVKFDLFEKINVNGRGAHPLWKFLTRQFPGPKGPNIDWNFTKFLIDKTGKVVARYPPSCKPLSLIEHLEKLW